MSSSLRVGALLWCVAPRAHAALRASQASITGTVKDTSGAVLPGVTVEASSPELIEKVRGAVTDATGQYRIENLRPGRYTVTFTLAGFSTVRREGDRASPAPPRSPSTPSCGSAHSKRRSR